ncbi:D-alanyl-D-alanine carboxypeptidase-like protein [Ruminiclostridium sufflavum DSM 19573]|uniref:D-alanyl-D-alanine carboxypeptidase-like protein n=1 Tax=Ruminiclostridium sufflavum DSM 19573 TaxID=1121337 RepID=A0A318XP75_9FIRM|nr:D-alanyl-D-alanine carboxypeptidase family protein [Ruminiclostridium sufflavum]PYG90126.1 D-alanyl-D-alanine carboxypeptidase-like protein [Ruminiclostridium sufflavum DSM 19573]
MSSVKFKYQDEIYVIQKLVDAVNALCKDMGKSCTCTSGYRSLEKQKIINAQKLAESKGNYQVSSGAVYNSKGQCIAAAFGASNHCFCIAMDVSDEWFKELTNAQLKKYGLVKPMDYEPWHVQLLEHNGISDVQKEQIRDSVLKGVDKDMDVKEFQAITGLTADGIAGPKTKEKAKEVLQCCQGILGIPNFKTAEELIKGTQSSPDIWLPLLKVITYFDSFLMNIYKKMRGE